MVQAGPELNKLGKVLCTVELIVIMLLAGRASLFIWKYPMGVSPTNWEEGVSWQVIVFGLMVTTPVLMKATPETAATI